MIETTTTVESTFQVLDPVISPPPGTNPLSYIESGLTQLTVGVQSKAIVFTVTKAAAYVIVEAEIVNTLDATPIDLGWKITSESLTGFTVLLSGLPDSANYFFRWYVQVPPA